MRSQSGERSSAGGAARCVLETERPSAWRRRRRTEGKGRKEGERRAVAPRKLKPRNFQGQQGSCCKCSVVKMALAVRSAAPVCLLLLLAHLPSWNTQIRPQREPDPDMHTSVVSKNNLKEIIKLLDHRIQVLHQKNLMHEHEISEKQDRPLTIHMKGSSVKEKATPSSLTTQEIPFPNNYSVLNGNKLHKISPHILMDTPMRQGAGTEEDKKERPMLPGLKQDKNVGNNSGRAVRTTNITITFYSADNSSKTQIDIFNLKDPREVPEVHVVASNIINQGIKTNSVVLKDNGLQVIVNSSVDKQVKHITEKGRRNPLIKLDRGITGKSTTEGSKRNPSLTALKPLKDNDVEESTSHLRFSEESNPKVIDSYDDSSQSIMRQSETPVKELENILNELKKESEMQEPSGPSEEMQSSVMENILQDLKAQPAEVQKSSSASESRTPKLMKSDFPSEEHQGPEETDSTIDEDMMPMEYFPEESNIAQVSNETPWNQPFKATPVPNLRTEVTNEDMNDAKRFEFFEKYEGIQDKKRAKAADLKDLLKHIIIACIAVTSLILAVIVLVHVYTSLFVKKKKQETDTTNTNIGKEYGPDQTEVTEERGSQQLFSNIADTENQNTVYIENQNIADIENQNIADIENQNFADTENQNFVDTENQNFVDTENQNIVDIENQNIVDTENQNIADIENQNIVDTENQNIVDIENQNIVDIENQNIVDIENQNNNNLSSPPAMFLTACEDVKKPLEIQPVETTFSPTFLSRKTDLLSLAESLGENPSIDNMGENLKVQSRTFKMNTSCKNQEQHSKAKYQDYKKLQDKDTAYRRTSNHRSSRHRPKSTEHKKVHTNGSSKHPCYRSSSWVHDSSNVSIAFDNENTNESRLSQHDGSACTCYQHFKGDSSADSYSD